jgi:hypothetical protein
MSCEELRRAGVLERVKSGELKLVNAALGRRRCRAYARRSGSCSRNRRLARARWGVVPEIKLDMKMRKRA